MRYGTIRISPKLVGICAFLSACESNPKTTCSAEAPSLDEHWVAIARSQQYSGPGNTGLHTTVYLTRTDGNQRPVEVLRLDEEERGPITLKMNNWLTTSHPEVASTKHSNPDFQAVQCAEDGQHFEIEGHL